jgi:hypothetical protein
MHHVGESEASCCLYLDAMVFLCNGHHDRRATSLSGGVILSSGEIKSERHCQRALLGISAIEIIFLVLRFMVQEISAICLHTKQTSSRSGERLQVLFSSPNDEEKRISCRTSFDAVAGACRCR